jgi:hypothetical protein
VGCYRCKLLRSSCCWRRRRLERQIDMPACCCWCHSSLYHAVNHCGWVYERKKRNSRTSGISAFWQSTKYHHSHALLDCCLFQENESKVVPQWQSRRIHCRERESEKKQVTEQKHPLHKEREQEGGRETIYHSPITTCRERHAKDRRNVVVSHRNKT